MRGNDSESGDDRKSKDGGLSDEAERKARPGFIRRLFGGGDAGVETAEPTAPVAAAAPEPKAKRSWFQRLRDGLSRSSSAISSGIVDVFTKRKLDASSLDDLEDILIQADLGIAAATRIREAVARGRYEKGVDPDAVEGRFWRRKSSAR